MKGTDLIKELLRSGVSEARALEFVRVHLKHPWIWPAFQVAVEEERAENKNRISAKACWERMRKNAQRDTGMQYALNNNWHSLYARAWAAKYPLFKDIFEFRELTKEAA